MASYGGINPAAEDIRFPYDKALQAAQDIFALAGSVERNHRGRTEPVADAREDWKGPHRDRFDQHMADENTDASSVARGLTELARAIARQWAKARGEQNRINWARYVDSKLDDDNALENGWEWVFGEDEDYGEPPEDPRTPREPHFDAPAGARLHPEFGP